MHFFIKRRIINSRPNRISTLTRRFCMSTKELVSEFALLMNIHGKNSPEAEEFLAAHSDDSEFVELANIARNLKTDFQSKITGKKN